MLQYIKDVIIWFKVSGRCYDIISKRKNKYVWKPSDKVKKKLAMKKRNLAWTKLDSNNREII